MADEANNQEERRSRLGGIHVRLLNTVMIALVSFVTLVFLYAVQETSDTYSAFEAATEDYIVYETAVNDMKSGSNYLTNQMRQFVSTQEVQYLANYLQEAYGTRRRDAASDLLDTDLQGKPAQEYLAKSIEISNALGEQELYAAMLTIRAAGLDVPNVAYAGKLADTALSADDAALAPEAKAERALDIMFGSEYNGEVAEIDSNIELCKKSLLDEIEGEKSESAAVLDNLLLTQQVLSWALLVVVIAMILANVALVLWPIRENVARITENKPLPLTGANELRIMAEEYNIMYEENLKHSDALRRKAEHDHMTGLYNREVFERLLHAYRDEPIALLLIDADYFKQVNDTYGHEGGDKILQKIANLLSSTFRSTDFPCRIGGDEFAVIMTEMPDSLAHVVSSKLWHVTEGLADTSDGLPAMTLSVGIAFSKDESEAETLFNRADEALYRVKEAGRNGHQFY